MVAETQSFLTLGHSPLSGDAAIAEYSHHLSELPLNSPTIKIGNLHLTTPCVQAPLSGYTDRAMRLLARNHGCPLAFAGVIDARAACHEVIYTKPALQIADDDRPLGIQLMGSDPATVAKGANLVIGHGYDMVDLNFACPAPSVLRQNQGGHMLQAPTTIGEIIARTRDVINAPLTAKLRIGYDDTPQSRDRFWQICRLAVDAGINAITVHGRTVKQHYRGKADWNIIAEAKRRYPKTVIFGSGDLRTAQDGIDRLNETKIDGVAFARGSFGNPWIFREFNALWSGQTTEPPSIQDQGRVILKHLDMMTELYPHTTGITRFHKFAINYAKRHPNRKQVHLDMLAAPDEATFRRVIGYWYGIN